MTFKIKRVLTKHVLTHNKDFALVELEFNGTREGFDEAAHRYGTIEYGEERVCLAECATASTIPQALQNREDFEDMAELVARFGGPDEAMKSPEFHKEFNKLIARA